MAAFPQPHPFSLPPAQWDAELRQCHVRLTIVGLLCAGYMLWFAATGVRDLFVYGGPAASLALSVLQWGLVRARPGPNSARRIFAIILDQGGCTILVSVSGEVGALVMFVYLWVTVGNGLRFGTRWLALAAAVASLDIALLGLFSEYWQGHRLFLASLLISNLLIPAYLWTLITKLHVAKEELAGYTSHLENVAKADSLTGLANRAALFAELHNVCAARPSPPRADLALLYFDLDGFKQVNDTYGHSVGDILLQSVASEVGATLRKEDTFARLGGDEFVILLHTPGSPAVAKQVADRVLTRIRGITEVDGRPVAISASVGLVTFQAADAPAIGAESLMHEADRNMYVAKKSGKNAVIATQLVND